MSDDPITFRVLSEAERLQFESGYQSGLDAAMENCHYRMRFEAAVAAMQGLLARGADFIDPKGARNAKAVAAEWSVEYADALLLELDCTTNKNEAKRE